MKNYYYNQKTQDLLVFDTEGNEVLVLERISGIRVFTRSELKDSPHVSHDQDFNQEAPVKVYKKYVADRAKAIRKLDVALSKLIRARDRACVTCGRGKHTSGRRPLPAARTHDTHLSVEIPAGPFSSAPAQEYGWQHADR
jgi:hypothetical protein